MNNIQDELPQLLDCAGDFSHLKTVKYKNRFLYSKYNPTRAIEQVIKNAAIQDGTLVLLYSPCLWYGYELLIPFLEQDKEKFIAFEYDKNLYALAQNVRQNLKIDIPLFNYELVTQMDEYIRKILRTGKYKRVISIEMSAGTVFTQDFYGFVTKASTDLVAQFWMNRITLVKMGRLFAKNIFENLHNTDNALLLEDIKGTISSPIIVCGAGESLDNTDIPDNAFIIAADAALPCLLMRDIIPNAVVSLESQYVIQKAYIGCEHLLKQKPPLLFADIASRPSVVRSISNTTVWFASLYDDASFLRDLKAKGVVQDFIPPLGSVGLACFYIALKLRTDILVPIFVTGLDFSYSVGRTHANGAPAFLNMHINSSKLQPAANYASSFGSTSITVPSKNTYENGKNTMKSIKSMISYSQSFNAMFSKEENVFDVGKTGIEIGLPKASNEDLNRCCANVQINENKTNSKETATIVKHNAAMWLKDEKTALLQLKDLLINGESSEYCTNEKSLSEQIFDLIKNREYLYLHFPDGYKPSGDVSFLKRVRAEIDFFLKRLKND